MTSRFCISTLFSFALVSANFTFAQTTTIPADAQQAVKSVRPDAIKTAMQYLADDKLEGRKPGTRGFEMAATYVQDQLKALGLKPAGEKGTYRQAVPLRRWQVRDAASSLTITQNGADRKLVYGKTFILNPNPDESSADVLAPVVFVGYGVSAPELGYDDYTGVDVKGKIVAYFNGAPASFPSNQRAYYGSAKAEIAAAHGAVGAVSFNLPTDFRNRIESASPRARQGIYRWVDKQGKPQRTYPAIKGTATLSDSAARWLFASAPVSFSEAMTNARKDKSQAFPLGVSVRMQTQTDVVEDVAGQNVVALLPGTDPALKDEYIVYVAHIDHLGIGRPVKGDSIYNGAHDNASGVAINLETARLFASLPKAPRRSIVFVGVTGEEMGLLGSDYFATNPTVPKEKIVANLSLDMPFFFHPLLDIVPYGSEHSSLTREVETAAKFLGVQIAKDPIPEQAVFMRSDHFSFVRQGIPSLFIKSGSQTGDPNVDGTKLNLDWRATIYHSPQDDMNQPFNFDSAAKHVQLPVFDWVSGGAGRSAPDVEQRRLFREQICQTNTVKINHNSSYPPMKLLFIRILGIGCLFVIPALLAFQSSRDYTVVYLTRHAEKDLSDPKNRNPALTMVGEERARHLAEKLSKVGISAIYTTNFIRTVSTVTPLATQLGLPVQYYSGVDYPAILALFSKEKRENNTGLWSQR